MSEYTLVHGDCLDAMREMGDASVDAIVTDPPYGLRFMGKRWDYDVPDVEVFGEMLRVLEDGGRLLCFAGARTAHRMTVNIEDAGFVIEDVVMWLYGQGFPKHGSKLKPAHEPIVVARKGGVSDLNIDAGRIETPGGSPSVRRRQSAVDPNTSHFRGGYNVSEELYRRERPGELIGRWPANVCMDERAAEMLDEQSGELKSGHLDRSKITAENKTYGAAPSNRTGDYAPDTGGASRFFYVAKASRGEREAGLEGADRKRGGSTVDGFTEDRERWLDRNRPVLNHHPTVKPVDLMRWLIRLVAKPGETVLDPFMGSGTTGVAATMEGVDFLGIERESEYVEIARRRIVNTQPSLFSDMDAA